MDSSHNFTKQYSPTSATHNISLDSLTCVLWFSSRFSVLLIQPRKVLSTKICWGLPSISFLQALSPKSTCFQMFFCTISSQRRSSDPGSRTGKACIILWLTGSSYYSVLHTVIYLEDLHLHLLLFVAFTFKLVVLPALLGFRFIVSCFCLSQDSEFSFNWLPIYVAVDACSSNPTSRQSCFGEDTKLYLRDNFSKWTVAHIRSSHFNNTITFI